MPLTEVVTRLDLSFGEVPNHFPMFSLSENSFMLSSEV